MSDYVSFNNNQASLKQTQFRFNAKVDLPANLPIRDKKPRILSANIQRQSHRNQQQLNKRASSIAGNVAESLISFEDLVENKKLQSHIYGNRASFLNVQYEAKAANSIDVAASQKDLCLSSRIRGQYS